MQSNQYHKHTASIFALLLLLGSCFLCPKAVIGHPQENEVEEITFTGLVLSKEDQHPLPNISVEFKTAGNALIKTPPTNAMGMFTAKIPANHAFTLRFYKELGTGHVLVASKKLEVGEEDITSPRKFVLPVSLHLGDGRLLDFKGEVKDALNQSFEGTLHVVSEKTSTTIGTIQVLRGQFDATLVIGPETSFQVHATNEDGENVQNIYQLDKNNFEKGFHPIILGEAADESIVEGAFSEEPPTEMPSNGALLVQFQGNSHEVAEVSEEKIASIAEELRADSSLKVAIWGFSRTSNLHLHDRTQRRVLGVVSLLKDQGVSAEQLVYSYYSPIPAKEEGAKYVLHVK